jgi:hypothetical protein
MKNGRPSILKTSLLFSLYFFTFSFSLPAQNEEIRFSQRLTWTGDEYARRYEVIIEKEEEPAAEAGGRGSLPAGEYREMLREFTHELFIEVSLLPGKYRCMVITHDFLNQIGEVSEWKYLEVMAVPPDPVHINDPVQSAGDQKKADIFLSAAWMPLFAIYDTKEEHFFGRNFSLAGAVARFGVVAADGTGSASYFNFKAGLELAGTYSFFDTLHLWGIGLNLLAQKRLPGDKMALTFRLGAGYSVHFQTNMGVSFMLFVMDNWYLETGIDYAHSLPAPSSSCFRPWVGVIVSSW